MRSSGKKSNLANLPKKSQPSSGNLINPMDLENRLNVFRQMIDDEIRSIPLAEKIPLFYDPIQYVNRLSGKKIRPLLAILSGLASGGKLENLLPPAAAVELLHNFSLVHDDIMDQDDVRRGNPTVHIKWDEGTAILTGDGLLGLAYRKLLATPNVTDLRIARLFTDAMIEICEGQALDKSFEERSRISESEYLLMIQKKTATLIQLSAQIGGIVGEADDHQVAALADFGFNLGMAFQIQDDLLDIVADEEKLGKRVGSDLEMHKKTIITIRLSQKTGH
ncbi:MAG: polyprenyl synthetase family protein, partial [Calditrichales bacterium]